MSRDPFKLTAAQTLALVLAAVLAFVAGVWMPLP